MFCSILPLNQKNNHIKETEHGLFSVPNLVPLLIFIVNILGGVTDQFSASSSRFTIMGVDSGLPIVVGGGRLLEGDG